MDDSGKNSNLANNTDSCEIWRNDIRKLSSDEKLQFDSECYLMYHSLQLDWPCLSFDILPDGLGACRSEYPHECLLVCGTQAENPGLCSIYLLKCTNLNKTELDDDYSAEPKLQFVSTKHPGVINRIRACPTAHRLVCTMSQNNNVYVWDLNLQLQSIGAKNATDNDTKPVFTNSKHKSEGYALGWNRITTGILATGDNDGGIILWKPVEGGWDLSEICKGVHKSSVEDIQWKPDNENVFSSASCDGKIRVFDIGTSEKSPSITIEYNDSNDINSISWNPQNSNMMLSGDENGNAFVWDIRHSLEPVAALKWHNQAIVSVDWHPVDQSVCACASRDDSITIWDLSVEADNREGSVQNADIPEQLMFIHMGQEEISEFAYHPLIPGVIISTASDGINIFQCSNV